MVNPLMMATALTTVDVKYQSNGFRDAANQLAAFRRELTKLDGAKATVTIVVREKSAATSSMIVDSDVVNRALTPGMRLAPSMLADYINNGEILPDKMAMFIAGLNRELAKQQERNRGSRKVIKSRKEFMSIHGHKVTNPPKFMYFKSSIGKQLNKPASDLINQSMFS